MSSSHPSNVEAQESMTPSEDWGSDDDGGDYDNYYGEDPDIDVKMASGKQAASQPTCQPSILTSLD